MLATVLALLASCSPPASRAPQDVAPASVTSVQLYAMDCGRIHIDDANDYADDNSQHGKPADLVDPCFLIRHPGGDLIWDTGLGDAIVGHPVDSGIYHISVPARLVDQLAQLHLTPADIEYLSLSHSHFDHTGNAALFTNATWIVDADERSWMFRPEARTDSDFAKVAPLEHARTQLIEGDGDYDVFGDGSVTIIQAPGHTPGHCVLLIRFARGAPVLLAGDMWHLPESRTERLVPRFNTSRAQTLASMDKLEALIARTHARVIRQHVPEDFAGLPRFPAALTEGAPAN